MQTQIYTYTHRYTDLSWHKLVLCLIKMIQLVWQGQSAHLLLPHPSSPISIYAFHGRWYKMIVSSMSVVFKQSIHTFVTLYRKKGTKKITSTSLPQNAHLSSFQKSGYFCLHFSHGTSVFLIYLFVESVHYSLSKSYIFHIPKTLLYKSLTHQHMVIEEHNVLKCLSTKII